MRVLPVSGICVIGLAICISGCGRSKSARTSYAADVKPMDMRFAGKTKNTASLLADLRHKKAALEALRQSGAVGRETGDPAANPTGASEKIARRICDNLAEWDK